MYRKKRLFGCVLQRNYIKFRGDTLRKLHEIIVIHSGRTYAM